ncbi:MAG TPA: glycoside hydrolase family 3 N-terminal domain-containing protein [Gemmatimonadales bacterium]|nr:glycoside hydrolase family 3 N-terminal domain-containing protein [Gemmatimonadales bacterium]
MPRRRGARRHYQEPRLTRSTAHRILFLWVLAGCGHSAGVVTGSAPAPDDLERLLDSLPVRAKAAQLVMPWLAGTYAADDATVSSDVERWVDSLGVGGLIVSVGSPLDIAAKLNHLQTRSRLPLLVASDLEAGTAIRLVGGVAFPTNMGVAAGGRESDAYAMGRITALEARAVGIHLAFAPVADVNNNPGNPIINVRSFGEDPRTVARFVSAAVRGMEEHGLLATAKHFPGHGDTEIDSHLSLHAVPADWQRLDSLELVPFRAAVRAGASAIMSAHLAFPGLAKGGARPGTVMPEVLTGLLRDSLGFQGLVVTDALDMGALVSAYGAGEAAVLALLAGADLLLQPAGAGTAVTAIVRAVESGRISRERLDRSVRRVLGLKHRLGLFERRTVPLEGVTASVGSAANWATAREVAARSIVLLKDSLGTLDSMRQAPRRVALVTYAEEQNLTAGVTLTGELRAAGYTVSTFRLWPASGLASFDSARALVAQTGVVPVFAIAVRPMPWRGTVGMPEGLAALVRETARTRPTILLSLGSPYLITQAPDVAAYLIGWSANPGAEWAAARALGGAAISGRLPIQVPPAYPLGAGLDRPAGQQRAHRK